MGILRLALALCVFAAHSKDFGIPLLSADVAVEVFFVISGFYMQLILSKVYTFSKMGKKWLQKFYVNRYLRLSPIYICVVITTFTLAGLRQLLFSDVTGPFHVITAVSQLQNSFSNIALKLFLFFTNITIFFQDIIMFLGVNQGKAQFVSDFLGSDIKIWQGLAIPQAWTLGIELSFYLISPYLLKFSTKKILAIAVLSITSKLMFLIFFDPELAIYSYFGFDEMQPLRSLWGYRFFPFEIGYFLVGALSFRLFSKRENYFFKPTIRNKLYAYLIVILSVTITSPLFNKDFFCWIYPIIFVFFLPPLFSLFKNSKLDREIGELSYPFYMCHLLCLRITKPLEDLGLINLYNIFALFLTLGFSLVLIRLSQRFDLIRERIRAA